MKIPCLRKAWNYAKIILTSNLSVDSKACWQECDCNGGSNDIETLEPQVTLDFQSHSLKDIWCSPKKLNWLDWTPRQIKHLMSSVLIWKLLTVALFLAILVIPWVMMMVVRGAGSGDLFTKVMGRLLRVGEPLWKRPPTRLTHPAEIISSELQMSPE